MYTRWACFDSDTTRRRHTYPCHWAGCHERVQQREIRACVLRSYVLQYEYTAAVLSVLLLHQDLDPGGVFITKAWPFSCSFKKT